MAFLGRGHGAMRPMGRAKKMLWAGAALWLASMLIPDTDFSAIGAVWLLMAPFYGFAFITQTYTDKGYDWMVAATGVSLWLGWLANILIFVPLSRRALGLVAILPWIPFAALCYLWACNEVQMAPWMLAYFPPWAIGILLICRARYILPEVAERHSSTKDAG